MAGKFLDIKAMMRAVDTRDKTWYERLSDDDKKLYSPYMTMKWSASVEDYREFGPQSNRTAKEWYVEEINERVNKHLWTLSKNHKSLLWRLTAGVGLTYHLFHKWLTPKKKKSSEKSKMKELQEYYPTMKQADLNILDSQLTTREWTEIKRKHGNDISSK